jgi:putative phosphoribosyl transferase
LLERHGGPEVVVLGAPRGGVEVAVPVALALGTPLDLILAHKLPAPGNPELGFGAVGEGGVKVVDREITELLGLTEIEIEEIASRVEGEIEERSRLYRQARGAVQLRGRTALVVDDGIATGVTMDAAIGSARSRGATRVIAAAPVSSVEAERRLKASADIFVCPIVDPGFIGVGGYYQEFSQLTDEDVLRLLKLFDEESAGSGGSPGPG